jgi:hypothetical protein
VSIPQPYQWLSARQQAHLFAVLAPAAIVLTLVLNALGQPLRNEVAPMGIISYELAGSLAQAQDILASWGSDGQVVAGLSLGTDFLYLVVYPMAIGLGCLLVGRGLRPRWPVLAGIGTALAWGLLLAGALDAVENIALIRVLLGSQQALWPVVARWCAVAKFLIVALGLLYVVAAGVLLLLSRARSSPQ